MKGRKQAAKLKMRQAGYDALRKKDGYKRPGSLNPKKQR